MRSVELTEYDRHIYEQEIRPYLPERVFDAHCHLIANRLHPRLSETMALAEEPMLGNVDCEYLEAWWKALMPDVDVAGMVMPFPTAYVLMDKENRYVRDQVADAGYPFAMMTHPKIARVIDGAVVTESGQPYIVMELIQGRPITVYSDE